MRSDTPTIGLLDNRWRQRLVTIHEHPTDPTLVISSGAPYDGGSPVVCEEPRKLYERVIAAYPKTAVYE